MPLQSLRDFADVVFRLIVARPQGLDLVARLLEEAEQALFLFGVEAFKFFDHVNNQIARHAQILRAHFFERRLRKISHLLLSTGAVLQNGRRIAHVNLAAERINHAQALPALTPNRL